MKNQSLKSVVAADKEILTADQVSSLVASACPASDFTNQSLLIIIPDGTRSGPIGLVFKEIHRQVGSVARCVDILVALGTHQPMSEASICQRLDITVEERRSRYARVKFHNHCWNDPSGLKDVGVIPASDIRRLSHGLLEMDVPVQINRLIYQYDRVMIVGPVFPHEVVGYSGGNKYFFPGIAGPDIVNFFHWLGALVTNPKIIGHKWTPVRQVVDRAAALVAVEKSCFSLVVTPDKNLAGLFFGTPEAAWDAASDLSRQIHIVRKPRPFHTILSCAPSMYDELWTAGKCMYKLEPVLADGGQLIIYAPHLHEISVTHGGHIREVGYHCRDFFQQQWNRYRDRPWGVLAHCTHVYGQGVYAHGKETPRAQVVLSTQMSEAVCGQINLAYRDPATIRVSDFANRESEGILCVHRAGETLFQLENPPAWAGCESL
jgi:lactate racemase